MDDFGPGFFLEEVNNIFTAAAIVANAIAVMDGHSNGTSATFGFSLGLTSLMLTAHRDTDYPLTSLALGTASILMAIWNLSLDHDPEPRYNSSLSYSRSPPRGGSPSPLVSVSLTF
jgi:hypothetical protein